MNSDWKGVSKENYLKICRFLAVCIFFFNINVNLFFVVRLGICSGIYIP